MRAVPRRERQKRACQLRHGNAEYLSLIHIYVYRDESALEFIRNPDGSMSLLIKNIIV